MKVLDLRCAHGHLFEGWFASEEEWHRQDQSGLIACPMCGDAQVQRLPSAPRLNLGAKPEAAVGGGSAGRSPSTSEPPQPQRLPPASGVVPGAMDDGRVSATVQAEAVAAQLQALWLQAAQRVLANTQDVGERFPEEARRIHYGEEPRRAIRGQASGDEVEALLEEGIDVVSLPIPPALKGPVQ